MSDHPEDSPATDPDLGIVLAVNFVADAGKQMLQSSTSVSEVMDRLRQFLPAVGLEGCALDATMSSLIVSYWREGQTMPLTTMRELKIGAPRLERLAGADALLDKVESGELDLDSAIRQLRELEGTPMPRLRDIRLAILLSVLGWVIFLDGLDIVTIAVALAATTCTFPVDTLVRRLRFPALAATFFVATIAAAIPNLLAAAGLSLLVGPAVVGTLFIYLPGRAFVSSVIDGLSNAPLSSISRGIQALATAGFLAFGMLVGNRIGTGFGLNYEPDVTSTPLAQSLIGSSIGVLGLAASWAMPKPQFLPTVAISALGWSIIAVFTDRLASQGDWPVYAIAAGVVGIAGAFASMLQGSSASVYTGVAILPLVPGFTLYTGMLALAQSDSSTAFSALGSAGSISLAIAIGVAIGLGLGRDTVGILRRVVALGPSVTKR